MGPIRWMSPEALGNYEYSTASDVWAFGILLSLSFDLSGVTLIEIYTGNPPSPSLTPMIYATKVINGEYSPASEIPSQVTGELRDIMEGCFKLEPKERPSFKGICQILETDSL